jgi:protein-tyrosine phosphatase
VEHLFWLIPGRLAGRPGPDERPWQPSALRDAGIGAVLSVNDGALCRREDFSALGMDYACIPFSANAPPRLGDLEICLDALPKAYGFVTAALERDAGVLVHCTSGKDRTGLFLCYFLMRDRGLEPLEAVRQVRRVRPIALSATGYEEFAIQVLWTCEGPGRS